jgi:hypothetical protein
MKSRNMDNHQFKGRYFTGTFAIVGGGEWSFIWLVNFGRNYSVSRPKCSTFFAERNYAKQILPLDSLFRVVPITGGHTFAPCNPVVKNVQ